MDHFYELIERERESGTSEEEIARCVEAAYTGAAKVIAIIRSEEKEG